MGYILLSVGFFLAALIQFSQTLQCVQPREPRLQNLISLNGFKPNETLELYLFIKGCERVEKDGIDTEDIVLVYNYSLFRGLIAYLTDAPRITDSLTANCKVQVMISKTNPGEPTYLGKFTQFYFWTDTEEIRILRQEPVSAYHFECPFGKVEKLLRESFNTDSSYEMTLFDISGQNRTLEDYRQGNVLVELV